MPEYIIRVGTPDGEIVERTVQARTARAAQEDLLRQGLHVFATRRGSISLADLIPRGRRAISTERFLTFNQELLALIKAGLPILQSFDIIWNGSSNPRFREILDDVRDS